MSIKLIIFFNLKITFKIICIQIQLVFQKDTVLYNN
jgi:hypothetical protein